MVSYATRGTCARQIDVEVEDGVIKYVKFHGGCNGNLKGIAQLTVGMKAEDIIARLKGITCGFRDTSCPDQLTKALEQALNQQG